MQPQDLKDFLESLGDVETLPSARPRVRDVDRLIWNDEGDSRVAHHAPVPVDEHGEITINIRRQGVFALTTTSPPLLGA